MHYENVCKNDTNQPKKAKKRKRQQQDNKTTTKQTQELETIPHRLKSRKVSDAKKMTVAEIEMPSNFSMGDLVWAKLFRHPCWPGIVTVEPGSRNDIYTQIRKKDGVLFRMYHVQFFEEPVQQSWLDSTNLLKFEGE